MFLKSTQKIFLGNQRVQIPMDFNLFFSNPVNSRQKRWKIVVQRFQQNCRLSESNTQKKLRSSFFSMKDRNFLVG